MYISSHTLSVLSTRCLHPHPQRSPYYPCPLHPPSNALHPTTLSAQFNVYIPKTPNKPEQSGRVSSGSMHSSTVHTQTHSNMILIRSTYLICHSSGDLLWPFSNGELTGTCCCSNPQSMYRYMQQRELLCTSRCASVGTVYRPIQQKRERRRGNAREGEREKEKGRERK